MQDTGQLQTDTLPGGSAFLEVSALLPYLDLFSWLLRDTVGSFLPRECALSKMNFTSPPPATREAPSSHGLWGAISVLLPNLWPLCLLGQLWGLASVSHCPLPSAICWGTFVIISLFGSIHGGPERSGEK